MRARIGFVFQSFNLWSHLTILGNVIEAPIHVCGIPRAEAIERAEALLAKVGIAEKRHGCFRRQRRSVAASSSRATCRRLGWRGTAARRRDQQGSAQMSRKTIATGMLLAFMLMGGARAEVLRIGTEGAYPPFNQIDPSGELIGFDIDIAQALCDNMKVTCEFVRQDWDGIIPGLLARKYDAIVASMSITEERKQAADFTDPYYSNKLGFVAAEGAKLDPANLKGKVIGAQRATISASYLEDHPSKGAKVKLYDTQENAYLDLVSGRVDVILADMLVSYEWLNSQAGGSFAFLGEPIDIGDRVGIAVRKGDTELLARLNAALAEIIADGTYEELNAKYFPFPIY